MQGDALSIVDELCSTCLVYSLANPWPVPNQNQASQTFIIFGHPPDISDIAFNVYIHKGSRIYPPLVVGLKGVSQKTSFLMHLYIIVNFKTQ